MASEVNDYQLLGYYVIDVGKARFGAIVLESVLYNYVIITLLLLLTAFRHTVE